MGSFIQNIISQRFVNIVSDLISNHIVDNWSQLAIKLDCSKQSINEIKQGRRDVTIELVLKLVTTYNISPDFLFIEGAYSPELVLKEPFEPYNLHKKGTMSTPPPDQQNKVTQNGNLNGDLNAKKPEKDKPNSPPAPGRSSYYKNDLPEDWWENAASKSVRILDIKAFDSELERMERATNEYISSNNIIFIPPLQAASFLEKLGDLSFETTLPRFSIPGFKKSKYYAFRVDGNSMQNTATSGDIAVCFQISTPENIRPGELYIIATEDDGIELKRLEYNDLNNKITVSSDNPNYKNFQISANSILAIYRVAGIVSVNTANHNKSEFNNHQDDSDFL